LEVLLVQAHDELVVDELCLVLALDHGIDPLLHHISPLPSASLAPCYKNCIPGCFRRRKSRAVEFQQ
jgi:hypothetical protein